MLEYTRSSMHFPAYNYTSTVGLESPQRNPGDFARFAEMTQTPPAELTQVMNRLSEGDREAIAELLPMVYGELHGLAEQQMQGERADHTLQPTALVHEAYIRLVQSAQLHIEKRADFFCVAATVMRHILVNHARDHGRIKRGGGHRRVHFDEVFAVFQERAIDLLALDEALRELAVLDPRQRQIVELRFFAGLTVEQTANILGVSKRTVENDWSLAKVWLLREITKE